MHVCESIYQLVCANVCASLSLSLSLCVHIYVCGSVFA